MDMQQFKRDIYDHDHPEKQYHAAYQMRFAKDDPEALSILFSACYEAKDPLLQQEAVRSLGVLNPHKAFEAFIKMTHNTDPEKRRRAYYHLGTLGNSNGFDAVLRGLRDPEETVRKAAAISAGRLGDDLRSIDILKRMVNDFQLESIKTEIRRSIEFIQKRVDEGRTFGHRSPSSFDNHDSRNQRGQKTFRDTSIPKGYTPRGF